MFEKQKSMVAFALRLCFVIFTRSGRLVGGVFVLKKHKTYRWALHPLPPSPCLRTEGTEEFSMKEVFFQQVTTCAHTPKGEGGGFFASLCLSPSNPSPASSFPTQTPPPSLPFQPLLCLTFPVPFPASSFPLLLTFNPLQVHFRGLRSPVPSGGSSGGRGESARKKGGKDYLILLFHTLVQNPPID